MGPLQFLWDRRLLTNLFPPVRVPLHSAGFLHMKRSKSSAVVGIRGKILISTLALEYADYVTPSCYKTATLTKPTERTIYFDLVKVKSLTK